MLEPTPQDIPVPDTPQVEVDEKTKRYRQAAEYNATLIHKRQEQGPFYYEPHTKSVQVLPSLIVAYNSSWAVQRPHIIKLLDHQQLTLQKQMLSQQQRQTDYIQQQQQILLQQQIVQQQILHQHHMEQQIKLHNQQRESRDQPPQEVVYNENGEIVARPRAAITTFLHFSIHNREALRRQHPHMNITDISKLMGSMWRAMSEEEQKPYAQKAKEDKRRFDKETEEYQKKLELFLKNRSWATRKPGTTAAANTTNTTNTTTANTTTTTTSEGDNKAAETSTSVDSPSSPSSPAQQPNKRDIKREPAKTPAGAKCEACGGKQQGPGQLVTCAACTKSYHPLCLQIIPDAQEKIKQESWKCMDCKICEVCNDPGHEDKLMICDACDYGYHTFCLNPPLNRPPLGGWRCQECVKCLHCGSKTPGTGASCKWRANYTACDSCYQLYLDGKFCPVCERVYRFTDKTPMVECEGCSRWVHIQCDNIDDETYKQMAEDDVHYKCPVCRKEKSEPLDSEQEKEPGSNKTGRKANGEHTKSEKRKRRRLDNELVNIED